MRTATTVADALAAPGGGRRHRLRDVACACALLFAALLVGACGRQEPAPAPAGTASAPTAAQSQVVVAVLPFRVDAALAEDVVARSLDGYLAGALDALRGVATSSAESTAYFADSSELNSVVGARLGATHLVRGTVGGSPGQLSLALQLLRASDGQVLWQQTLQRPASEVFALQDDAMAALTRELHAVPAATADGQRPPQRSLAAYQAYLQGREAAAGTDVFSARQAVEAFERAVVLDAGYAEAHARLALARVSQMARFGGLHAAGELAAQGERARRDAATALRLAPDSSTAHLANAAWLAQVAGDHAAALQEVRRALLASPDDPDALQALALRQNALGDPRAAAGSLRQALRRNPLSAPLQYSLGTTYLGLADYAQAEHALREAIAREPTLPLARALLSMAVFQQNRTEEAVVIAGEEPSPLWRRYALAMAYWANGDRARSDAELQALEREHRQDAATQIAGVYAQRDDRDAMFKWLDEGRRAGDPGITEIRYMPFIARYADDPRFVALARDLSLLPAARQVP